MSLAFALQTGRSYISNGDYLVILVSIANGALVRVMGDITPFPRNLPPNIPITVLVPYSVQKRSTIEIYRGRVGDQQEARILYSPGRTGSGFIQLVDTLANATSSYYRAYSESDDQTLVAYTNPVFFARQ